MKAGLLDQVKEKHTCTAWNRYKRNRTDDNWKMFVRARNETTRCVREAKRYFERRIAVEVKTNQKRFWNMVRVKYMTKPVITEIDYNGVKIIDDADKAECLNQFFASVFTEENTSIILADIDNITYLETITVTEQKVKKLLAKLKTNKSPGPDGIHNKVIYEAREQLLYPLTEMFRTSIETGDIPPEWKMADIVPIFKKGLKSDPNNYRPVSLTSTIGKLLETLVRNAIQDHLVCNKLMCDEQHGFRSGRSCCTQLLEVINDWSQAIDDGDTVDTVYLDYRKAFDSVPHLRLLSKLESYGIKGSLLRWIKNFLTGRIQSGH